MTGFSRAVSVMIVPNGYGFTKQGAGSKAQRTEYDKIRWLVFTFELTIEASQKLGNFHDTTASSTEYSGGSV
jgi:hypothetical protein